MKPIVKTVKPIEILEHIDLLLEAAKEYDERNKANTSSSPRYYWESKRKEHLKWKTRDIWHALNIFDWWKDYVSVSDLKQMKSFLQTAIAHGYTGYACFKMGVPSCAHGMWANVNESTDGYSPDGAFLYHSFRSGDNYYCIFNGSYDPEVKDESGSAKEMSKREVEAYFKRKD